MNGGLLGKRQSLNGMDLHGLAVTLANEPPLEDRDVHPCAQLCAFSANR